MHLQRCPRDVRSQFISKEPVAVLAGVLPICLGAPSTLKKADSNRSQWVQEDQEEGPIWDRTRKGRRPRREFKGSMGVGWIWLLIPVLLPLNGVTLER